MSVTQTYSIGGAVDPKEFDRPIEGVEPEAEASRVYETPLAYHILTVANYVLLAALLSLPALLVIAWGT